MAGALLAGGQFPCRFRHFLNGPIVSNCLPYEGLSVCVPPVSRMTFPSKLGMSRSGLKVDPSRPSVASFNVGPTLEIDSRGCHSP